MSQAMLSMMDAMGNLAQDYNRNKSWSSGGHQPFNSWQGMNYAPWGMYAMPGAGMPGQQQIQGLITQAPATLLSGQQAAQGMIQQAPGMATGAQQQIQNLGGGQGMLTSPMQQTLAPPQSSMDGIWQGQGGEIVLVMYGHFRIYANADNYRDGRYAVRDNWLVMYDPETGAEKAFEYALSEGRLVLRGEEGPLLLFRQLPIPIPPYAIFSGQAPQLPKQQGATNPE
jgi:hypothetical protein